ncbi:MAG TPA: ABC transporter ATP-binding protein [bacterium]|jgi:ABC-2 type transport system ATP-binding protein|nr:ABC transporter ATP-binding protein [bacterium]
MTEVIGTTDLSKIYGRTRAVDNLNLSVKKGEIFGFLGLNGAGKTTTIRLLLGLVRPTSGNCRLLGKKISAGSTHAWPDVGYIVETPHSYPELTVRENLEIVRRLRGIEDRACVDWIIRKLKLQQYEAKKAAQLSLGNAQRLGLAKAIIHQPKILLLDEPTNGLDPAGIVEVRRLLVELATNYQVTILVSSHKLGEIAKMATRIGIIHNGKLIKEMDSRQLERQLKKSLFLDGHNRPAIKSILAKAGYQLGSANLAGGSAPLEIRQQEAVEAPDRIATLLVKAGHPPTMLKVQAEDLEAFFLRSVRESGGINDD